MSSRGTLSPAASIERSILIIRGERVMLDAALAELYGVETRALVQAVKRNADRFPPDFAFELTSEEFNALRSQFVISKRGGRRYLPYAFTEQGVAMLSSVLRSGRAVQVNIEIMRTFVRLRQMIASNAELARRLRELEKKYDAQFKVVFDAIRQLMAPPEPRPKRIGFRVEEARPAYRARRLRRSPIPTPLARGAFRVGSAALLTFPSPPFGGEGAGEGGIGQCAERLG